MILYEKSNDLIGKKYIGELVCLYSSVFSIASNTFSFFPCILFIKKIGSIHSFFPFVFFPLLPSSSLFLSLSLSSFRNISIKTWQDITINITQSSLIWTLNDNAPQKHAFNLSKLSIANIFLGGLPSLIGGLNGAVQVRKLLSS